MSTRFLDRCSTVSHKPSIPAWPTVAPALAALLAIGAAGAVMAADPPTEPYIVFVAEEAAYARCGPDGEYYRTDPLRLGQELEVHVETEEGWLGIRPPENSFSWIPASTVQRIEGGDTARVIAADAVAWIGTSLGRARKYRWQIQLAEGEEVVIVGQSDRQTDTGTERWYRIVPPSGEFRWVHRSQIASSAEELVQRSDERRRRDADVPPSLAANNQMNPARRAATASVSEPPGTEQDPGSDDAEHRDVERSDADRAANIARSGDEAIDPQLAANPDGDRPRERRSISAPAQFSAAAQGGQAAAGSARSASRGSTALQDTLRGIAEAFNVSGEPVGSGLASAAQLSAAGTSPQPSSVATPASVTIGGDVVLRDIATASSAPSASATAAAEQSWTSGVHPAAATSVDSAPAASSAEQSASANQPARHAPLTPTAPPALRQIDHDDPVSVKELTARVATADIAQLQLELSRQMAAGASATMVQPIRQRAADSIEQATDPADRGRARLLLERVEQYQRVAQRRSGHSDVLPALSTDPSPSAGSPDELPASTAAAMQTTTVSATETVPAAGSDSFDRSGYLVQVYSARPDSPPFALTDASGRTLAYVSPAPGLNLRRYLNTQVGLYGQVSYHTGLDTPHLIAQRAVQTGG